jgi:hypothetical protein
LHGFQAIVRVFCEPRAPDSLCWSLLTTDGAFQCLLEIQRELCHSIAFSRLVVRRLSLGSPKEPLGHLSGTKQPGDPHTISWYIDIDQTNDASFSL